MMSELMERSFAQIATVLSFLGNSSAGRNRMMTGWAP
jgi:hypothetical protein